MILDFRAGIVRGLQDVDPNSGLSAQNLPSVRLPMEPKNKVIWV